VASGARGISKRGEFIKAFAGWKFDFGSGYQISAHQPVGADGSSPSTVAGATLKSALSRVPIGVLRCRFA